jgi:hypothetical protein
MGSSPHRRKKKSFHAESRTERDCVEDQSQHAATPETHETFQPARALHTLRLVFDTAAPPSYAPSVTELPMRDCRERTRLACNSRRPVVNVGRKMFDARARRTAAPIIIGAALPSLS